jgi:hypothetical protein
MRSVPVVLAVLFAAATAAPARAEVSPHPSISATAATTYALQQNPANPAKDVNVDINVNHVGHAWYRSPVWIAIAVLAGIVLLVLLMLAFRGTGGGGTTIIRE